MSDDRHLLPLSIVICFIFHPKGEKKDSRWIDLLIMQGIFSISEVSEGDTVISSLKTKGRPCLWAQVYIFASFCQSKRSPRQYIFPRLEIRNLCCQAELRRKIFVSKSQTTNQFHKSTNSVGRLNQPVRLFGQLFIKQSTRQNASSWHSGKYVDARLCMILFKVCIVGESGICTVEDKMHSFSLPHDILRKLR